jgi:hypothetical protein
VADIQIGHHPFFKGSATSAPSRAFRGMNLQIGQPPLLSPPHVLADLQVGKPQFRKISNAPSLSSTPLFKLYFLISQSKKFHDR